MLEKEDYEFRQQRMKELQDQMDHLREERLPEQKRVSIAAGMADFDQELDMGYIDVFNRADAKMYENKAIMKRQAI